MKRREFITLLGGAAVSPVSFAKAQQASRVWRLGCLLPGADSISTNRFYDAFRLRLHELGYVEGRNLILDVKRAEGHLSRLPELATELVSLRPDALFVTTTPAVYALQRATLSIPIVMGPTGDPIKSGFVKSLAKPGGNITGLSLMSTDLAAKSLELLNIVAPNAKRIAALMSANPMHETLIKEVYTAAHTLGLTIVPVAAAHRSDLEDAFSTMRRENCDGLVVLTDPVNASIPELAAKARLPAVYAFSDFVKIGGLLSYGPNMTDTFRRAADYVDKIFKGANPADLPVEQPTKFELVLNLRTAKSLGLTVPPMLLARADEVIE